MFVLGVEGSEKKCAPPRIISGTALMVIQPVKISVFQQKKGKCVTTTQIQPLQNTLVLVLEGHSEQSFIKPLRQISA